MRAKRTLPGRFEFLAGDRGIEAAAGSLSYVPRGTLHAFENVGEGVGRLLISQTPGGLHEWFFEEVGEKARDSTTPPDVERIAAKYGIEIPPAV